MKRTIRKAPRTPGASKRGQGFDFDSFSKTVTRGKAVAEYGKNEVIFSQGDPCNEVCYLERGRVKVSVLSPQGKEAVIAIAGKGHFFGEDCLSGRSVHMSTATALSDVRIVQFDKGTMLRLLQEEQAFLMFFTSCLLARTIRVQEDLLDHLFNDSERRLARTLLLLADIERESKTGTIVPKINQETLAAMIGTTRPRINSFMRKFRKLGLVEYDGELRVHRSLGRVLEH
jgi:CRP/FNR family cyclic AMP-dependent transcriptional regulator